MRIAVCLRRMQKYRYRAEAEFARKVGMTFSTYGGDNYFEYVWPVNTEDMSRYIAYYHRDKKGDKIFINEKELTFNLG